MTHLDATGVNTTNTQEQFLLHIEYSPVVARLRTVTGHKIRGA